MAAEQVSGLLSVAVQRHRAGLRKEAEAGYRAVLERDPRHADALHLYGVLAAESSDYDLAVAAIGRAIALRPGVPVYYNNLGLVFLRKQDWERAAATFRQALALQRPTASLWARLGEALANLGRHQEAVEAYRQSIKLDPRRAAVRLDCGRLLELLNRLEEAEIHYRRAAELEPANAEAWFGWANVLFKQERFAEAAELYARAAALNPSRAEFYYNLGAALAKLGRRQEAAAALGEALLWKPDYAEAYNNLGANLQALGRLEEAERNFRTAATLKPDYLDAVYNLGFALQEQERLEEALECYQAVLARRPDHQEALNNRAGTLLLAGRTREALAGYEALVRLNPEHAEANWNRALLQLQTGDWRRGWEGYEWRFRQKDHVRKRFEKPRWTGEPVQGKTILVHAEQGLGDTIQFVRFLAPLERLGCRVVLETQPRLKPLLAGLEGVTTLIARGEPLPEHDLQIELMSLPARLGVTVQTLPAAVPYLRAEPERVEFWRRRIGGAGKRRIGLVWSGNPDNKTNRRRSLKLKELAPLARIEDVALYSLQRGEAAGELNQAPFAIEDLEREASEITDTVAMMENLDLVITVDTVTAHLAGALARPVWLLLAYAADWRWMEDPERTVWYPTMRLFRQQARGDWAGVVERVARAWAATGRLVSQ